MMHCELCGLKCNEWLANHGSQEVVEEMSFGTPTYGYMPNEIFTFLEHASFQFKEGRIKWYVRLSRNFISQRHNRKRNISQETTSEKGVISQSFQVSRRLSHKLFYTYKVH